MTAFAFVQIDDDARLRGLLADHLGIDPEDLPRDASLVDELAVDSLELAELALAIENAFGIALSRALLDDVRTVGDLLEAVHAEPHIRRTAPVTLRARILAPDDPPGWYLERNVPLTPYAVETIAEDARHAGRGARVELTLARDVSTSVLAWLRHRLGALRQRGIVVDVQHAMAALRR